MRHFTCLHPKQEEQLGERLAKVDKLARVSAFPEKAFLVITCSALALCPNAVSEAPNRLIYLLQPPVHLLEAYACVYPEHG